MSFRTDKVVRFGDVDQAGIVYYPRLVDYFHVAMEDFFQYAIGVDYALLITRQRFGFPAVNLQVDFMAPIGYGDRLEIETNVEKVGRTSVTFRFVVTKKGESDPVAVARVVTVSMNLNTYKKTQVPQWLRDELESRITE